MNAGSRNGGMAMDDRAAVAPLGKSLKGGWGNIIARADAGIGGHGTGGDGVDAAGGGVDATDKKNREGQLVLEMLKEFGDGEGEFEVAAESLPDIREHGHNGQYGQKFQQGQRASR